MSFSNPSGLWLLLGVPILILIYIIRSRYEEKAVSGTYLWLLSRKFMKKRLPMQKLKKFLLFLLQLLIICSAALMAARPTFVDGKVCDYVVLLDLSASMQTENEKGISRMEAAFREVEDLLPLMNGGHTFSVIGVGDSPEILVQNSTTPGEVKLALNRVAPVYGGCNVSEALSLAQIICDRSINSKVLFFTDTEYVHTKNIEVMNMNRGEWNVAVKDMSARPVALDTVFTATLVSYNRDCEATVGMEIDGKTKDVQIVSLPAGEEIEVEFTLKNPEEYETCRIFVDNEDGLLQDNEYAVCKPPERSYKVFLASKNPLYLKSVFSSLEDCELTVKSRAEAEDMTGYDLYLFDGVYPEAYPEDGSVIQFGTGFLPESVAVGGLFTGKTDLIVSPTAKNNVFSQLTLEDSCINQYKEIIPKEDWEVLLYGADIPVAATAPLSETRIFTLFSFDLHDSNLPLQEDYIYMMNNLLSFSVPGLVRETDVTVGSEVRLYTGGGEKEIYLEYPDGTTENVTPNGESILIQTDSVGIYTVASRTQEGGNWARFFVHIPKEEGKIRSEEMLEMTPSFSLTEEPEDAVREMWRILSAAMLVILLLEWGWYYREQI